jgi:phasin
MAKKAATDAAFPTFEMPKFEMPKFDMPKFDMPKMDVPEAFRDAAEKSLATAKEAYEKSKLMAEEASDVVEDTYASASKGSMEIVAKAMDNAKASTDASFAFGKSVIGAKSVAELVELNTSFVRAQFDAFLASSKEFSELVTKVSNDAAAPMKAASEKAMSQFKKSA